MNRLVINACKGTEIVHRFLSQMELTVPTVDVWFKRFAFLFTSQPIFDALNNDYKFTPVKGNIVTLESGWMKTVETKTTIIFDEFTMDNEYSMDFIPYYAATPHLEYENSNGGIIFNYSDEGYYMLSINCHGLLQLEKNSKNKTRTLESSKDLQER